MQATLTPVALAALAKGLDKMNEKTGLPVGEHAVDETVTLRVLGTVTKGLDSAYTPTADIPLLPTMALLLSRAGVTREGSAKLLTECMLEAMRCGTRPADEIAERIKDVQAAMETVKAVTGKLPQRVRAGAVHAKVTVEVLSVGNYQETYAEDFHDAMEN